MEIKGKRVIIAPLKIEDVYCMREWGYHEDSLLMDYNFPSMNNSELHGWYKVKTFGRSKEYYGVTNREGKLVGYMGIKNIKKIKKEATLGIVFDPNHINKGYGTEAITTYLNYYFNEMKMKTLLLEVAKFNKRALRCYEKSGFVVIDLYLDKFFNQDMDLTDPYYLQEKSSFVIKDGKIYNYIYKMKVDRKSFLKER
ncbi:GNAT family N-acetyltransferase [Tissierella sp. MSJ-40]|uniref:GNAT family N-acetyltransferase n=1 Tax=Tissierella simiarum TaxID=2841534 RepID=A0ABS6E9Z3_9FIRM|nr:GNAT family N-acetyltransferase [Tissierella simiarum]MBU5439356.1 GNAT family N-acetyltransferase [Tissierella simiarum]